MPSAGRRLLTLPYVLLITLLIAVWVAGGASRGDALGQLVVRLAATTALIAAILFGPRPAIATTRAVWLLLGAATFLAVAQLVPLPPSWWTALPGRSVFEEATRASGQPTPWRPIAIVPGAAYNALASLIVPWSVLVLIAMLNAAQRGHLLAVLLALIIVSALIGLMQFSGARIDNPLINDSPGEVSGTLANRNHFATLLGIGCLLIPLWALDVPKPGWRIAAGIGLLSLFVLLIVASGSRAGVATGLLGVLIGTVMVRAKLRRLMVRGRRWVFPATIAGAMAGIVALVLVSVVAERAASVDRLVHGDLASDMRVRALPTVLQMISRYFPAGSGLGGFDPMFRISEPFALLKITYFNHAHNDFLEIGLDAGLPGMLLLAVAIVWWGWASVAAWRRIGSYEQQLGSAIIFLVALSSFFDYPARTPIFMAILVIAATWLSVRSDHPEVTAAAGSALPGNA